MRRGGHRAAAAPDGREALAALGEVMPDVVLLDLMMPQMDGVQFLQVLRSYLRWQHVPVLVLTAGTVDGHTRDRLRRYEVDTVLRKAECDLPTLLAHVNAAAAPRPSNDSSIA